MIDQVATTESEWELLERIAEAEAAPRFDPAVLGSDRQAASVERCGSSLPCFTPPVPGGDRDNRGGDTPFVDLPETHQDQGQQDPSVTSSDPAGVTAGVGCPDAGDVAPASPAIRFADLLDPVQRAKALKREATVQAVLAAESEGATRRAAVMAVIGQAEYAGASRSAVYCWISQYLALGLDGLVEQKLGRVGRKSYVDQIPAELLTAAKAASVEHGTLGPRSRQNMARAVRETLVGHPDLPADVAAHVHGQHASKSYVAPNLRRALRVSPLARAHVQGPHAAALAAPHIQTTCDTEPGYCVTADDMTANVYCWVEAPTPLGYIIGRPQVLAWLDVGSHRWLVLRTIMRQTGQYTRDDVWGGIGDVMEQFGVFPHWLFESGNLWRSKLVIGERTGLSDDERFGGLRSLGCTLHRSVRPQSKPVEQAFNELQYQVDRFPGYCGRAEREDGPEYLERILIALKKGQMHPRGVLPHITTFARHVQESATRLNAERQDGRTLRGQCPDEKWDAAKVSLPALPRNSAWLFRSQVSRVTVRANGDIKIELRSGKYSEEYWYRNGELLLPRAGQTLLAYWNDRNPEADCVLMTATKRPEFVGCAQYARPVSRFNATDDEIHAAQSQRKAAMAFARSEVAILKPHFERDSSRLQSLEHAIAPELDRACDQVAAAAGRAEAAAERTRELAQQTRVMGARAADELLAPAQAEGATDPPMSVRDRGDDLLDALQ